MRRRIQRERERTLISEMSRNRDGRRYRQQDKKKSKREEHKRKGTIKDAEREKNKKGTKTRDWEGGHFQGENEGYVACMQKKGEITQDLNNAYLYVERDS